MGQGTSSCLCDTDSSAQSLGSFPGMRQEICCHQKKKHNTFIGIMATRGTFLPSVWPGLNQLGPCSPSECGSESHPPAWQTTGSHPERLSQNLRFNKTPWCFCTGRLSNSLDPFVVRREWWERRRNPTVRAQAPSSVGLRTA